MGDPEGDRMRPRESLGEERETASGSMSFMAEKVMKGWRPKRNGCEFTVVPDEICFLATTPREDLS